MSKSFKNFFGNNSALEEIFNNLYPSILEDSPLEASKYFKKYWNIWENHAKDEKFNNSVPGAVFEKLFEIYCYLLKYKIIAKDEYFKNVPLVKPDFLLENDKNNYLFLSLKTSLRERWKQADWEAIYFKQYYPDAVCILVTFNAREESTLQSKINEDLLKGLDNSCLATSSKFDDLLFDFYN